MAIKIGELRGQSVEELVAREKELAEQLFALRLQKVTGQLEKPARVREVRRDLARVLTVKSERRSGSGR
jgi:large subunit ribosomal protein L29